MPQNNRNLRNAVQANNSNKARKSNNAIARNRMRKPNPTNNNVRVNNTNGQSRRPLPRLSLRDVANLRASFFINDKSLMNAVAAVPFNQLPGIKYPRNQQARAQFGKGDVNTVYIKYKEGKFRVPTALGLQMSPSFADADSLTLAARALFAKVRAKNSGAVNYEAQDLMYYNIMMSSLAATYAFYARVYGLLDLYSERNRSVPVDIFRAMGLPREVLVALQAKKANFHAWLQIARRKINALYIPKMSGLLLRWWQLNSKIYLDSQYKAATLIVPSMRHFYLYDEAHNMLVLDDIFAGPAVSANATDHKFDAVFPDISGKTTEQIYDAFIKHFDIAINHLSNSTTLAIISGDCQKVFGEGFTVPEIPQSYAVTPEFDPLMLDQIRNTVVVPFAMNQGKSSFIAGHSDASPVSTLVPLPIELGYGSAAYSVTSGTILQDVIHGTISQCYMFGLNTATAGGLPSSKTAVVPLLPMKSSFAELNMNMDDPSPADITLATRGITLFGKPNFTYLTIAKEGSTSSVPYVTSVDEFPTDTDGYVSARIASVGEFTNNLDSCISLYTSGSEFCFAELLVGAHIDGSSIATTPFIVGELSDATTSTYSLCDMSFADSALNEDDINPELVSVRLTSLQVMDALFKQLDCVSSHPAIEWAFSSTDALNRFDVPNPVFPSVLRDGYNIMIIPAKIIKNINVAVLFSQCNFGDAY